jgi:aconitate decarboxylase
MKPPADLTARVCERIVVCGRTPLDARLLPAARQLFLDGVAVAVAGARLEEAPRILAAHFADPLTGAGGGSSAALLGLNARLGTVPAALVNGAAMHVLDYEPMWLPATHALSPALAAALALGETLGSTGAKILHAMVLGIEIQGRLRQAAGALESHELHFHPPGYVGPIGAAVAAGHLLDFDADQFANAIGIAGSRCGGLFVNLGTMTKATHCAYLRRSPRPRGCAAHAARFHRLPDVVRSGAAELPEAFFPRGFAAEALLDFGEPFRIVDPGYAMKIFPAKFSTHYAITAALSARPQVPSPEAIRAVRITAADVPSSDRPQPRSGLDGKFSLQYTTAAALLDGQVGLTSFTNERLHRDDMQALLGKIEVQLSRDIPSIYTAGRYLDLEVTLADGKTIRSRCDRPRGSWGSSPITTEEHLGKARDCLATHLTPDAVATCVAACCEIDSLDAQDVAPLLHLASNGKSDVVHR